MKTYPKIRITLVLTLLGFNSFSSVKTLPFLEVSMDLQKSFKVSLFSSTALLISSLVFLILSMPIPINPLDIAPKMMESKLMIMILKDIGVILVATRQMQNTPISIVNIPTIMFDEGEQSVTEPKSGLYKKYLPVSLNSLSSDLDSLLGPS